MKFLTWLILLITLASGYSTFGFARIGKALVNQSSRSEENNPDDWKYFLSMEGGFRILMPGQPSESTRELKTSIGNLRNRRFILDKKNETYKVAVTEFPDSGNDAEEIRKTKDWLLAAIASDQNVKLLSEREVKIEGFTGRELVMELAGKIIKTRFFMTNNHLYQITLLVSRQTAFASSEPDNNQTNFTDSYKDIATRFFDSFELLKVVTGKTTKENFVDVNKRPQVVSGGVINGRAVSLPRPSYPDSARDERAEGVVSVRVLINEEGKVIEATSVSGHPALRAAAEKAARSARFTPTKLEGMPVKVTGIINYRFTLQ